jgi:drug/metabolite transporter (DMT)-like permease
MSTELLIAIGTGLGGMLGWGFADFFAKKTIDRIGDVPTLVLSHLFGTLLFFSVALSLSQVRRQPLVIPDDIPTWVLLGFFGALQAAVYLLVYRGFAKGQVAVLNPLFASFSGLTAVISIVAFGEPVSAYRLLALSIVFGGILLTSIDVGALRQRHIRLAIIPGLKEVAIATVLAALWTILWDRFVGGRDWLSCALFMYAFMTAAVVVVARYQRLKLSVAAPSIWKFLILIGLCETGAYLAISLGYSQTSLTSVVALLSGAFSLPTILLARAFLRERTTKAQAAGSVTIIFGIALLPWT